MSNQSIAALYVEIEKAAGKGMLPRGGKFGPDRFDWMDPTNGRRRNVGGFLTSVKHGGADYHATGKTGRNFKTGKRVAEYSRKYSDKGRRHEARAWADVRGKTYGD